MSVSRPLKTYYGGDGINIDAIDDHTQQDAMRAMERSRLCRKSHYTRKKESSKNQNSHYKELNTIHEEPTNPFDESKKDIGIRKSPDSSETLYVPKDNSGSLQKRSEISSGSRTHDDSYYYYRFEPDCAFTSHPLVLSINITQEKVTPGSCHPLLGFSDRELSHECGSLFFSRADSMKGMRSNFYVLPSEEHILTLSNNHVFIGVVLKKQFEDNFSKTTGASTGDSIMPPRSPIHDTTQERMLTPFDDACSSLMDNSELESRDGFRARYKIAALIFFGSKKKTFGTLMQYIDSFFPQPNNLLQEQIFKLLAICNKTDFEGMSSGGGHSVSELVELFTEKLSMMLEGEVEEALKGKLEEWERHDSAQAQLPQGTVLQALLMRAQVVAEIFVEKELELHKGLEDQSKEMQDLLDIVEQIKEQLVAHLPAFEEVSTEGRFKSNFIEVALGILYWFVLVWIWDKGDGDDNDDTDTDDTDTDDSCEDEEDVDYLSISSDLYHAGDYGRMLDVLINLKTRQVPCEESARKLGIGVAYFELSDYPRAVEGLEDCIVFAQHHNLLGDVAYAYVLLGDIDQRRHQPASATVYYEKAIDLDGYEVTAKKFIEELPVLSQCEIVLKLAMTQKNNQKIGAADRTFSRAIDAEGSIGKPAAYINYGNFRHSMGEHAMAVPLYKKGIELSKECGDMVSYAWAHGNLGNTYLSLSQHKEALHYLQQSLELTLVHEPTPIAIGRAHNNLGTYYQAVGDLETAQYHYDTALAQAVYGQDVPGQARAYGNIGNVHMLRKNQERAIPHYTEVLRLSRDRNTVVVAQHNRGCAYFELGEKKKTLEQVPRCQYQYLVSGHAACKVESEHQVICLSPEVTKHYQHGLKDLSKVIEVHEESFSDIKGSLSKLSVPWFETNAKTFLRAQDCAYNVGDHYRSLVYAEQCRARTLGELLHRKKWFTLDKTFRSPLQLDDISSAVRLLNQPNVPVVVLSYTGTRLLVWVLVWDGEEVRMSAFEQEPTEELFDGQTFDQYVRYTLSEMLTGSLQIYGELGDQKLSDDAPSDKLFELIGKPLLRVLDVMGCSGSSIVFIPDSYTKLLPFSALYDSNKQCYLGDSHSIVYSPSLLTLGIMSQTPAVEVHVPLDSEDMCVVGNPNTPPFRYNDEEWDLGPLPFATEEAHSVAHMLQCTPLLHEEATKSAVMAKMGRAKMIHLATHGSAGGGFLVLGTTNHNQGTALRHTVDNPDTLLLKASDVESMDIPAALVVLSSCDSGRGVIRGDDIQGMARSFLLAGARAVLTSLWKAPDESASFFMQYFYRYLLDGHKASKALQKTSLSIRCFTKYSDFVHWSGHQLTGQDVTVTHELSSQDRVVQVALGRVEIVGTEQQLDSGRTTQLVASPFPRFNVVHKLVEDLANINSSLTDVQLLCGPPGVDLMEPVMDYICSYHTHYSGGIAWLPVHAVHDSSALQELLSQCSRSDRILVVVDCSDDITSFSNLSHSLLNSHNTDVIIIAHWLADDAKQHVKHALRRPVSVCEVQPLSVLHATQRLVYAVQSKHHLPPSHEDQAAFQQLAHLSTGSPILVRLIQSLLHHHIEHSDTASNGLQNCLKEIEEIVDMSYDDDDEFLIRAQALVTATCDTLSTSSQRLLHCLSCLDGMPVSQKLINYLAALINPHKLPNVMMAELSRAAVLLGYPSPVVCGLTGSEHSSFFYVPQTIAEAVWSNSSIHNKCLSLLLMKQVVMTVHQPHSACLCHRVIQALETTMISDCQEQDTVVVMGLKDSVSELTEHFVSTANRMLLPAPAAASRQTPTLMHKCTEYRQKRSSLKSYVEEEEEDVDDLKDKDRKQKTNELVKEMYPISVEEYRKAVSHVSYPVYKTPDSTPQSLLVVSTVTLPEVAKPRVVYQPALDYTVSKQVYEAITMPEVYVEINTEDALVAKIIKSKYKNSYYYKDDGGDDFSVALSSKPTTQEWSETVAHYKDVVSDEIIKMLLTGAGMFAEVLKMYPFLLVYPLLMKYSLVLALLRLANISKPHSSIAKAWRDVPNFKSFVLDLLSTHCSIANAFGTSYKCLIPKLVDASGTNISDNLFKTLDRSLHVGKEEKHVFHDYLSSALDIIREHVSTGQELFKVATGSCVNEVVNLLYQLFPHTSCDRDKCLKMVVSNGSEWDLKASSSFKQYEKKCQFYPLPVH